MSTVPFSPARAILIAHNTLLEAVRHRLLNFLLLLAVALVAGARWFRDFNFGAPELKFLADCGFGAMAFFGAALVIAATAQLFFGELENRTALTLLAKPVWRAEFILGKFLGIAAVAALFCALLTLVLVMVLWTREGALLAQFPEAFPQGRQVHYANVVLGGVLQWMKLCVLAALTLLVASFAQTQLFTVVTGFFVLVICHLQALAGDAYARAGGAVARAAAGAIAWLFPNFQLFSLAESLAAADAPAWADVARVLLYGLIYIGAGCALATYSFRHREI